MIKNTLFTCAAVLAVLCSCNRQESMEELTARVFERAVVQFKILDHELDSLASLNSGEVQHPRSLKSDGSLWASNRNWWCSGYFPGSLWMVYGYTGDEKFKDMALKYQNDLEPLRFRTKDHDVGVQLMCSYGNCLRMTDNPECVPVILDGAKSLSTRFDPEVGCTRSWNHGKWNFPVIIDNMLNLELLLKAAELGGDASLKDMALTHARTTMKNHFREDNSCFHLVDYDHETGEVVGKQTVQGYADESAWARGQAWALYGYSMMYRFTQEQDMLDQAVKVAEYIIPRLPEDYVPYWDYDSPSIPDDVRDASSAAIMASALIELSTYVGADKSARYLLVAEKMLRSLASDAYLMGEGEGHGFLLKHSTGNKNKDYEVDAPLTYADYHFLEALMRWSLRTDQILQTGWVIPQPNSVETSEKVFDKAYLERVVYKEVKGMPEEAYELKIADRKVVIRSSSPAGRFYAEKTLEQLSAADVMHCMTIKDEPRFEWRGFMLDEARHFFGKEKVNQLLDMMARYKLNRFHWHLSDSQGWRIEIKAYPELCEVGAVGCYTDGNAPAQFYTQEEIREIVEYAAARHIEVIPEIDMPGHAGAATRAIPDIDGTLDTFNPGIENTYKVLGTVIKELAGLFPGRYIHIGGDEVNSKAWPELPEVKALMERENLKTMVEVRGYFTRRMADTVSFYGKQMVGWEEVLDTGTPSEGRVIHWWRARHPESLDKGIEKGFKMVVCPNRPFYLDYVQSEHEKEGRTKYVNTLRGIYEFRIADHPLVIGTQSNLWTERVGDGRRVDYMIFPRLLALAELAWTRTENMDYQDFLERLYEEYDYMDSIGLYYYDMRNPSAHPEPSGPVKR